MSLRLLLDEDNQAKLLIRMLREAGHDVETVSEANLIHKSDAQVLAHAKHENRLVMTRNCDDFAALHRATNEPAGVLAIYQHNADSDLSNTGIVQAIANLEAISIGTAWQFQNEFIVLNQWHYQTVSTNSADE